MTDGDTDTLQRLRGNLALNGILTVEQRSVSTGPSTEGAGHQRALSNPELSCQQLLWGNDEAEAFLARTMIPQANDTSTGFDLVFGSDLVYVDKVIAPLFETVRKVLKHPNGSFLMAHCIRREGNEVTIDKVLDRSQAVGLVHTIIPTEEDDVVLIKFRHS